MLVKSRDVDMPVPAAVCDVIGPGYLIIFHRFGKLAHSMLHWLLLPCPSCTSFLYLMLSTLSLRCPHASLVMCVCRSTQGVHSTLRYYVGHSERSCVVASPMV